jgi:DtxR family Mn-dependent transcriptional regulator
MPPDFVLTIIGLTAASALLAVALCWPRHGLWAWYQNRRCAVRQARVDHVLKHLCRVEAERRRPTLQSVAGVLRLDVEATARLLEEMAGGGWLNFSGGELRLTPHGRAAGMHIIRAHRLWECFLAEQTGLPEGEWHARAERREHRMSPTEADALSSLLGNPTHDPHGDPIPTAGGSLEPDEHRPLASLADGEMAVITHIEDEPENLYQRLASQGLRAGMTVRMLEQTPDLIRFTANCDEHALESILANQLEIASLPEADESTAHLAACETGARVTVQGLARSCRGQERRRLLDLGFVAGTAVEVAMTSPSGEPTAYRVRGTLIALHREQARQIMVSPESATA